MKLTSYISSLYKLTVKDKIDIIKFCDANPTLSLRKVAEHVTRQLGRSISRTSILKIKEQKDLILRSGLKSRNDTQVKVKRRIELEFEGDLVWVQLLLF